MFMCGGASEQASAIGVVLAGVCVCVREREHEADVLMLQNHFNAKATHKKEIKQLIKVN